jgi:hypothetical protein
MPPQEEGQFIHTVIPLFPGSVESVLRNSTQTQMTSRTKIDPKAQLISLATKFEENQDCCECSNQHAI